MASNRESHWGQSGYFLEQRKEMEKNKGNNKKKWFIFLDYVDL